MLRRVYDATWGRLFARGYDRFLAATEEAGLADRRRTLLAKATGRTLEIGGGTGVNLQHYPGSVTELVVTEPFGPMFEQLRERAAGDPRVQVVQAPGERLPGGPAEFDTVVLTLVLCTVPDPSVVLGEAARVLRPGGRLLFLEHVRSEEPGLARWQDRLERPWAFLGHGCHCNRDTLATIRSSPLEVERVETGVVPKSPAIVRPLISGSAIAR